MKSKTVTTCTKLCPNHEIGCLTMTINFQTLYKNNECNTQKKYTNFT